MTSLGRVRRRSRPEQLAGLLVVGGLVLLVAGTYVVVVLGGGLLIGHISSPHLGLSVLATAVVALAFDPVQVRLQAAATRFVHGGQPSPYDVLQRFSATSAGSHPAEELPARMAHVLADGTGAAWAQVWLVVDGRPTLTARWPLEEAPTDPEPAVIPVEGRRSLPVRHGGELLGVLVVQERPGVPLTPVEERLFHGLASQAGLVLRGARLRTELEARLAELATRAEELRASRQRLVDAQDAERRLLERDIHDGAQQHLVALAVNLRLADTIAIHSPDRAARLLADQERAAVVAIDTLARMSRGIYPALLTSDGPVAALRAAFDNSPVPVEVVGEDVGWCPPGVAAAAYFCCVEAVQNALKHAAARTIRVELRSGSGTLELVVVDDGAGFDPAAGAGAGLANMRDRVEALDGTLTTSSSAGRGTRVRVVLPFPSPVPGGG